MFLKHLKRWIEPVRWMIFAVIISGGMNAGCVSSSSRKHQLETSLEQTLLQEPDAPGNMQIIQGSLTIAQAVQYALENNQDLKAVRLNEKVAQTRKQASFSGFLPKVDASGAYKRLDDELEDDETVGSLNQYHADISIEQPLFRGGASLAEREYADWNIIYTGERLRGEEEAVIYEVVREYYNALLADQLLKVAEDAVLSAEVYLDNVMRKRENGAATEYAVLRARVDVSLYQAEKLQQLNQMNMAVTRLLQCIGAGQQSDVKLIDELPFTPLSPEYGQAVYEACMNRPDVRWQQADVYMRRARLRKAKSHYSPIIKAVAEQHWARPDPHRTSDNSWGDDSLLGIQVELPLFDGLIRESEVAEKKAQLKQSQIQLQNIQEKAALDVQQALLRLRDAERFVQTQKMNLTYAREGLRLADAGYAEGVNTEIDVTDARAALTKARGLHYQAVYDHAAAVLMYKKAVGQLAPVGGM